ncbi:sugar/nucleoside kinase (ribokinase family) [Hoeflea marina]|uniref:Sugar/nucleoside kinase (Ribokinase family) n=1 Tax=Hoeflea marina TaxID=274592 RepID=A0A317PUP2_9HYPH|nr:carbohydrate kinase family protein [Hoeflea marina]PWW04415.1 sugar/nucleoside kinase (ribokinase family) [Hoeflea marina]
MARILAVGGAHIDRKGWLRAPHVPGASNPGRWEIEAGGGAFNAARNLSRLGHRVTLVSPRGGDDNGDLVARAAEAAGVEDCPITFLDRATPSYSAILEPDGNLVTALADMALYDMMPARRLISSRFRARLAATDFIICDANLPADTIAALAQGAAARRIPIAAIAISPAKVVRLIPALACLDLVCMNSAEAAALAGAAASPADWPALLGGRGLRGGLVSSGEGPALAFAARRGEVVLAPPPLVDLADVTGAGDALAAGFVDGLVAGLELTDCLARGIACAQLTARIRGAVRADLSPGLVTAALADCPIHI